MVTGGYRTGAAGSLQNQLMSRTPAEMYPPTHDWEGQGATELWHSDRHAYTIGLVYELKGRWYVDVLRDNAIRVSGSQHDGSIVYEFRRNPHAAVVTLSWINGAWRRRGSGKSGSIFVIGERSEWYAPEF